jgi:hypothetical protein
MSLTTLIFQGNHKYNRERLSNGEIIPNKDDNVSSNTYNIDDHLTKIWWRSISTKHVFCDVDKIVHNDLKQYHKILNDDDRHSSEMH